MTPCKFLLSLLFVLAFSLSLQAQNNRSFSGSTYYGKHNKAVFLELGGSGLIYSLNYDMRINRGRQDGIGFRVGIGGLGANVTTDDESARVGYLAIPATFNYVLGKRRHALEMGLGATLFHIWAEGETNDDGPFGVTGTAPLPHANFGYRYQALDSGFFFRLTYTPFITAGHFAGVSFGFNFK